MLLLLYKCFIGTWSEQYYNMDFFGGASPNDTQGKLLDENWQDRFEVLKALLDVIPKGIMIQVRYPQLKQRFVYDVNAVTTVAALGNSATFSETDKAKISFHNDCLFASADDFGNYLLALKTDITNLKPYFKDDSKYVTVSAKTCNDGYSPENDCTPAGMVHTDLRELNYTYLNADYNNEVAND